MSCGCGCGNEVVAYEDWNEVDVAAAEYQGRSVTLNKPFRTPGGNKKFGVYTKNGSGTVVIVRFGDPNMEIKRDDPARRKAFRSRHNCDTPGPKWKARYWSCRQWRGGKKVEADEESCGCEEEKVEAAEPTPKADETHDEYMTRCEKAGYSKEECMAAHEGHEFPAEGYHKKKEYASECGIDEEFIDGECRKVSVTLDLNIEATNAFVEASTGNTVIEITGVAFHEGMNKNKWSLTEEGARMVAMQMEGADVTLNHPDPNESDAGFGRNTDGDLDKSNVGYIKSATYLATIGGGYEVRYIAHVTKPELFETLESGLYLKKDYGVSIGGSGIPVSATEDGIVFGEEFTFDHLALVYRPAYPRANIESVRRVEKEAEVKATFISHSNAAGVSKDLVNNMSEEIVTPEIDYEAQIESLKADLVLASSRVSEFEAADEARAEMARASLVEKATEIGMSGHEDLQTETLENLIASWEASHPEPVAVEMKPIDETPVKMEAPVVASEEKTPVVANYLNGEMVESDEGLYARAFNAWASAWNGTLSGDESNMRAKSYDEIKEMI
tara:strand:- start:6780 stop:8450 length:1671 start_codon:yes stop_codon:yes gene_type:complete